MSRILFHFERFCCALASWFPRVGVNLVTGWGIYTLVVYVAPEYNGCINAALVMLGTWSYAMATVAYFRTVGSGGGSPLYLPGFVCASSDIEAGIAPPPPQVFNNVTAKENGEMRFCTKCQCWKPDRTHHCKSCKMCILRMDHHCPWFSTCIGFRNHKFFIMFLYYVSLLCSVCFVGSMGLVYTFFRNGQQANEYLELSWVLLATISGVFGLAVGAFSGYSLYLVLTNQTTLEAMESVRYKSSIASQDYRYAEPPSSSTLGNVFDLGKKRNWCEVMGYKWYEWILPIHPAGMSDGTSFPIDEELWTRVHVLAEQEAQAAEQQAQYMNSLKERRRREIEESIERDEDDVENIPLREFVR
ncbi:palmitoyltransferase Pfa3p [Trichomonascus vanleenenianus]|uniref:palmitoyltransferase PFA3 n=1 Tax=Trichomonascus vanleenenianus TaxID=2268995 RepID=UPI003ECA4CCE